MYLLSDWTKATYSDIEDFVKQYPYENTVLEYKSDLKPQHGLGIPETCSAFANTYGGLLIIGVAGDDGNYRLDGIDGGSLREGALTQSVVNQCVDQIWPALVVHPQEVWTDDRSRVTVLARVWPSRTGPHFI